MFSDSGNGFLDLSTIRINLKIRNTGAGPIRLTGGHTACIFQRLQSRIRGQLVDDVLYYGRLMVRPSPQVQVSQSSSATDSP
jgi:hypothetical protein